MLRFAATVDFPTPEMCIFLNSDGNIVHITLTSLARQDKDFVLHGAHSDFDRFQIGVDAA